MDLISASMRRWTLALVCAAAILPAPAQAIVLSSPDIGSGQRIATRFAFDQDGCGGQNRMPRLSWRDVPPGTKSLALALFDPDAPRPQGWVHWLVMGISPGAASTAGMAGSVAAVNDFGTAGYGGPCPPPGDRPHRYVFTLYALDRTFPFDAQTTYAQFLAAIVGHVLATATLTGRYGR